jgi:hypothetical protein
MFVSSAQAFKDLFKSDQLPPKGSKEWKIVAKYMRSKGFVSKVIWDEGTVVRGWVISDMSLNQDLDMMPTHDQGMTMMPLHDQKLKLSVQMNEKAEKKRLVEKAFGRQAQLEWEAELRKRGEFP